MKAKCADEKGHSYDGPGRIFLKPNFLDLQSNLTNGFGSVLNSTAIENKLPILNYLVVAARFLLWEASLQRV